MKVAGWCEAHYIDLMPHNRTSTLLKSTFSSLEFAICNKGATEVGVAASNATWWLLPGVEHSGKPNPTTLSYCRPGAGFRWTCVQRWVQSPPPPTYSSAPRCQTTGGLRTARTLRTPLTPAGKRCTPLRLIDCSHQRHHATAVTSRFSEHDLLRRCIAFAGRCGSGLPQDSRRQSFHSRLCAADDAGAGSRNRRGGPQGV